MSIRKLVLTVSLLGLFSASALAQEDEIDTAIAQSRSSNSVQELQAQASAEVPKTDDWQNLCVFYHKRGVARLRLGDYSRAVDDLRLALAKNQPNRITSQDWGERWRIQLDLSSALRQRGDWFGAIEFLNDVAREYKGNRWFRYHIAMLQLTEVHGNLGDFTRAEAAFNQANDTLPTMRQEGEVWARWRYSVLMHTSNNSARFFRRQGNYAEAERLGKLALDYAQQNVAMQANYVTPKDQTLRSAVSSLAWVKLGLADVLATRGKYGEAEFYARAEVEDRLAMYGFATAPVSSALAVLGWVRFQQGDLDGAQRFYRHATAALQGSGVLPHSTRLAERRAELANMLLVRSRWQEALAVFDERDRGLRSDAEQFSRTGSDHESWVLGLLTTGQSQRAAEMAERLIARQLKRPVPNRWYLAQLRGVLGMALAASGKTAEALKAYQESVPELIRRDQDDATAENIGYWRAFWQQVILEGYLELLAQLQASGAAPANLDLIDESFRIADIARGSSVQEAITATAARAQLPDRDLAELARKEQDALNRIVELNRILARLASAAGDERHTKIISDMRSDIERLRGEHVVLRTDIRKRYPEYAELVDPKLAGISEVRKALAPGEALVSIYLGESQSYVWTIAAVGKATFRVIPFKRTEIESDVRELRQAMDFGAGSQAQLPPFDLARAYRLYRAFFEADEALWNDAQVLNVIPHGALGQLPFALLVTAAPAQQPMAGTQTAYREVPWLIRKVALAQLPSANAFVALRRAPPAKAERQPFAGFGDPLFTAATAGGTQVRTVRNLAVQKAADGTGERLNALAQGIRPQQQTLAPANPTLSQAFTLLSALPDTAEELREIAAALKADPSRDVFLARRASEKNVKQAQLENRRVVAFATHGIAGGVLTGLDQPALVLSNPALTGDGDNDGFLTMEEVLGLKLDADWVVLSACNTAAADGRGSEAVSGLGRAFFFAGARSLLVSNWAVETTSARLLTTELFRRQSGNPDLTRAEALRQSMLTLMGKSAVDATGRATFSYAHPAYWAPFALVGDGRR